MTAVWLGQKFLKQQFRVRISIVLNIFTISLTFVRNSIPKFSHGRVGRTAGFWSKRSRFESLTRQMFLWFHCRLSENPMVPMAQWVGQQGSWAVSTVSNLNLYLRVLTWLLRRKIVKPSHPIMLEKFRYRKSSKPGRVPYEIFWYCETKNWQKLCLPPYIPHNFRNPKISETQKVRLRNVSVLWDITVSRENHDRRPSPLIFESFWSQNLPELRRVPLWLFSLLWDQKTSKENRDYPSLTTLLSKKFFDIWSFLKHLGSPTKLFGTLRQNNFDGKPWYPPTLSSLTLFDIRMFLKRRRFHLRIVSSSWDNNFYRNSW